MNEYKNNSPFVDNSQCKKDIKDHKDLTSLSSLDEQSVGVKYRRGNDF